MNTLPAPESRSRQARAARGDVEAALDRAGWPWRLSRWIDALVVLAEDDA